MLLPESAFGRQHISIHALREEGDEQRTPGTIRASGFLSTPSARGRPAAKVSLALSVSFLSTPSARRATDSTGILLIVEQISIHALREEGDGTPRSIRS